MTTAKLKPKEIEFLSNDFSIIPSSCRYLAGDGSSRVYFQGLNSAGTSIVIMKLDSIDQDLLDKDDYPFIGIDRFLEDSGFRVPKILGIVKELGIILLEDFGALTLEDKVRESNNDTYSFIEYYSGIFPVLKDFILLPKKQYQLWQKLKFDETKLHQEFNFFLTKYVSLALDIPLSGSFGEQIQSEISLICRKLADQSDYFCHRDFHSRNLMWIESEKRLGIIDFQDARLGPPHYDLISLLYDPYVPLNYENRDQIFNEFIQYCQNKIPEKTKNIMVDLKNEMIIQRLTKALGSFGYLALEMERGDYLKYQIPTLDLLSKVPFKESGYPNMDKLIRILINHPEIYKRKSND